MSTIEIYFHTKARKELDSLDKTVRRQFHKSLSVIENNEKLPAKEFKKLKNYDVYELRIKDENGIYRGFGTFKESKFILLAFFTKKTQKVPKRIIKLILNRYRSIL